MSSYFTKVKLSWPRLLRAVERPDFGWVQPTGGRSGLRGSCRAQIGQPFQIPTDAFELQFQPVGFVPHIPHPPVARRPLPPAKHFFNLAPDRTEQPVDPHTRRAQLFPTAGLAQNPVGHTVLPAPLTSGPAPIRLVGHDHF